MYRQFFLVLFCLACGLQYDLLNMFGGQSRPSVVSAVAVPGFVQSVGRRTRRWMNLGSTFGSPLSAENVYDRITGHPVFAVTTSWGSPYLNMERLQNETIPEEPPEKLGGNSKNAKLQSISDDRNEIRMVVLYYMDPVDALATRGEMKQMQNLDTADIRVSCFSLAKAIRQASNIGRGLVTGVPVEPETGDLSEDSGRLRYKIVPPKKQLFYAARCIGRERVGLGFGGSTPAEDAARAVSGNAAIDAANLQRRRTAREATIGRQHTGHPMEGYTGIPVFYCEELQRKLPFVKRTLFRRQADTPLFFDYEDVQVAWKRMRRKCPEAPAEPTVEVFNLMDVLSSMDREKAKKGKESSVLGRITFIPSSQAVHYKEGMSKRGNSKARLRPMR